MAQHDEKIKQLLNQIENQKHNLGVKPKVVLNTNGLFWFNDKEHFNINTVNNTAVFVNALGFLLEKQTTQTEAAKRLGLEKFTFDWNGYSLEDWEHDFKLRTDYIAYTAKQKNLQALEKKLMDLRSEEAKTADVLDTIEKTLVG